MVMWKKILLACITLAGSISVGYAFMHQMNAAGTYAVATHSTGRVGLLKQGDRIYMGTLYNGSHMEMQLLKANPNNSGNNVWLAMSKHIEDAVTPYVYNDSDWTNLNHNYSKSLLKSYFEVLNGNIISGSIDDNMIIERTSYVTMNDNSTITAADYMQPYMTENRFWCLTNPETQYNPDGRDYQLIDRSELFLLMYDRDYWTGNGSSTKPNWISFISNTGVATGQSVQTKKLALRATAKLNLSDVVFALSTGSGSNYTADITNPTANTSNIWNTVGDPMKIRVLKPYTPITITFDDIKNSKNDSIQKAMKGTTITLHYSNATVGTTNTVSLLLTDTAGSELKYYEPLETASASGIISFDTSNIPIGQYQAFLVNEEYTADNAPVYASPLSSGFPLEITEHKLTYTKQP